MILNVQNYNNQSFKYRDDLAPYSVNKHSFKPIEYLHYFEEKLHDIKYFVNFVDISKLEKSLNISIILFSYFDAIGEARYLVAYTKVFYIDHYSSNSISH